MVEMSKSQMKRIAELKGLNRPPKNPKVPTMPASAQALAQKLREIIDAGGEQSPLAYGALSRLCVMWVPGALESTSELGGGQMGDVFHDVLNIMLVLFPNGEGLPPQEGYPL